MGTRMKNERAALACCCTFDFQSEKLDRKLKGLRFHRIPKIDNIRCVNDNIRNVMGVHKIPRFRDTKLADVFPSCILRRAGIKHKGISLIGGRFFG